MVPEVYLARAIGACYAGLYIVSNYGEGLITNWEGNSILTGIRTVLCLLGAL